MITGSKWFRFFFFGSFSSAAFLSKVQILLLWEGKDIASVERNKRCYFIHSVYSYKCQNKNERLFIKGGKEEYKDRHVVIL